MVLLEDLVGSLLRERDIADRVTGPGLKTSEAVLRANIGATKDEGSTVLQPSRGWVSQIGSAIPTSGLQRGSQTELYRYG